MTTRDPEVLAEELIQAAEELNGLQTADDVKSWWKMHYSTLGHRRLGRLLIGNSVERLLEGTQRGTSE